MHYDVFNGDADGIFALHQYRLAKPLNEVQLITGVKRDIRLLARLEDVHNCHLSVFDISLDSNRAALLQLLQQDNTFIYFDHHFAGDIPESSHLQTHIATSATTCTAMLVNSHLAGRHCLWAICGAFGDNLNELANRHAEEQGLSQQQTARLQEMGELFNYNGYGASLDDLHYHPQDLYKAIAPFSDPFDFFNHSAELAALRIGYEEDLARGVAIKEMVGTGKNRIYILPDRSWARRVSGVLANVRARQQPHAAHAVISENNDTTLGISVRAPLDKPHGADTLCRLFPNGGGRKAAAGINHLPPEQLEAFIAEFLSFYR